MSTFYKDFGTTKVKDADFLNKQLLHNLFKKVKKDTGLNMPRFQVTEPHAVHQADLLFLPEDNGYKYALVIVDAYDRTTDAEPLKNKDNTTVLNAFKAIYQRGALKNPRRLEVDSGSEFKGSVQKYFNSKNTKIRVALPGRHRQQALVERKNQQIGDALFKRMVGQEILTGQSDGQWIEDLPVIIEALNKKTKPQKPIADVPVAEGDALTLLDEGIKVRVALDEPREVHGKKLHGKFRSTDIRWDPKPHVIEQLLLKPGYPPMYRVDGKNPAYTKNQLQVIPKNEQDPNPKVIRGKPETYVVEKLIDHKKERNVIYYKVKWRGFPEDEATWEKKSYLMGIVPEMITKYNNNH